ncbi:MAG TPA: EthD domain-containing protein [Alphaproteobacteria bacterium]
MALEEAVTYFIRYQGIPRPHDDFVADYSGRHVDILSKWPGIRRIVLHLPMAWRDPHPVKPDPTDFLCEMSFANADALRAALNSEARALGRADRVNLKHGSALVTHQAMRSLRLL